MKLATANNFISIALCSSVYIFQQDFHFQSLQNANAAITRNDVQYIKSQSGLEYYDYKLGEGIEAHLGDKVSVNVKGYLAGRQGWLYENTFDTDTPIRLILGQTPCIKGLELGITGDVEYNDITPMKKGGKRRLVIPSRLGYQNTNEEPIPISDDLRRRLYSTVLNQERGRREKEALGDSLVGKIILDIELLRVKSIN